VIERAEVEMGVQARTVAVIDDDLPILESLVNLLASSGYKAEPYSSAEQFLGADGLSKTSCIVTDVEMQHMSGLDLLHHVMRVNSPVPVIVITGKPSENSETFYLERGAAGFFRKPVDGDALVDLLTSVLLRKNHSIGDKQT
jgi:FixJ family two-component response regulator